MNYSDKETYTRIIKATIGVVALIIGGLIYILYRSDSLLMFDWFHKLGLSNFIDAIRIDTNKLNLYGWVKNSMPAGLWLFSYMFVIDSIWGKEKNAVYNCFLYVLPIIAMSSELMQYFKFISGTFDIMDLLSYILAVLVFKIIKLI